MKDNYFCIENRRYIGSKAKLANWITNIILTKCQNCYSFADLFAGTGVMSQAMLQHYPTVIINDFLFSNHIIYQGFFKQSSFNDKLLHNIKHQFNQLDNNLPSNYFSKNYGDKFFSKHDAKKIGYIREYIEQLYIKKQINHKEYAILLTSLIYSLDKISNTVGHYEAYIKGKDILDRFVFELIRPICTPTNIQIHRQDANILANYIQTDIAFIDPPYNSRQYSRFYHLLETLIKWDNPQLFGVAMKPKEENMSNYCRTSAPMVFDNLITDLNAKYIAVTYNNTYASKSSSSQNKISLDEILSILQKKGETSIFETPHQFFNAGKTDFNNHKEYLFITKVI